MPLDKAGYLKDMIWSEFSSSIQALLENPFIYQPFWDAQIEKIEPESWREMFDKDKKSVVASMEKQDTLHIFHVVLNRLYTLRNQLIHGGATWNGQVNRDQVRDGANFLGEIVPLIIQLMLDNPDTLWGPPCYPVVNE